MWAARRRFIASGTYAPRQKKTSPKVGGPALQPRGAVFLGRNFDAALRFVLQFLVARGSLRWLKAGRARPFVEVGRSIGPPCPAE
jgi:hypothetical protein